MNKNTVTLIISLLLQTFTATAQKLTTDTPVYDCGQVLFRQPVTAHFNIRNKSSRQIVIKDVKTSCGCTTAAATDQIISGGKETTVDATYDAKQLGHFQKEIWIYEEGQKKPLELMLRGVVVTEIKDYSGTYPYTVGNIRTDRNAIEFDDVYKGSTPMETIHILNTTGETIQPVVMHLPEYMTAEVSPTRIAPEQGGEIRISLNTERIRDLGLSQTTIYLGRYPGDKISQEKEIPTSAILLPSFSNNDTSQYYTGPQIQLSATDMPIQGMTGKPDKLKGEIIIQNVGKEQLEISALQMFTLGLQVSLGKTRIAPSESTKLKITANGLVLKQQKQKPRILMITNDPNNPKVIVEITGI
ncbi:MAG: DUF1573 domain-containing protein [Prevotella sp.]